MGTKHSIKSTREIILSNMLSSCFSFYGGFLDTAVSGLVVSKLASFDACGFLSIGSGVLVPMFIRLKSIHRADTGVNSFLADDFKCFGVSMTIMEELACPCAIS